MKRAEYRPYNLDMNYLFDTYRNIGKVYGNRKYANRGVVFNIIRWYKRLKNRRERRYKNCDVYSEWEKYVKNILGQVPAKNYSDMIHFLIGEKNYYQSLLDGVKSILIPLYIAILGMTGMLLELDRFSGITRYVFSVVLAFVVMYVSLSVLVVTQMKVEFYQDLIGIAKGDMQCELSGNW